jgi:SulP family sulfate permease
MSSVLKQYLPSLAWLPAYRASENLRGDVSAGLTVGVMLIPQGMAYALIAGLPPIYGLYAALVPLVVYALLGTSRQLAVGPVAMVSLLVAAGVAPLAGGDAAQYITLAMMLAFMVGVIQLALGLARFGFIVNFLSHPVLSGFTSAAAVIIGMSQLKHILGVPLTSSKFVVDVLMAALASLGTIHLPTLALGAGAIVVLVMVKRINPLLPGALIAVVLGIGLTWVFDLDAYGVKILGTVPEGLPRIGDTDWFDLSQVSALLPTALTISLVGFMESIAVAKSFASRNRYEIDANQELVALGAANVAGSFSQSFPVTGGFSRTAINGQAGAVTPMASLISALVIAITLLFLTPLFTYLPNAVLGAIVMVAVAGLVDVREMRLLWRVKRSDWTLLLITFFATLGLGIEEGILIGVVASLIVVIRNSSMPHTTLMGRLPGTRTYRNVERFPEAEVLPNIAVLRVDASMYFANASFVKDRVRELIREQPELQAIVIDAYPINQIDSSATHALEDVLEMTEQEGIVVYFAGVKGPVRDVLDRAGVTARLGVGRFTLLVADAVEKAQAAIASQ